MASLLEGKTSLKTMNDITSDKERPPTSTTPDLSSKPKSVDIEPPDEDSSLICE
jgi:hypothetical protein